MNRSIYSLTGIRGVAALWVVFYHMQDVSGIEHRFEWMDQIRLTKEGYRGVDLFFILSGFILMYVHQNDFITLTWKQTRRYLIARFWRVYPLNAAVLLLMIALAFAVPDFIDPAIFTPAAVIQSFAIAQRWFMPDFGSINGPSWSLSVEILGYAVFPLITFAMNRIKSREVLLLIAVMCLAVLVIASFYFGFASRNVTGRMTILRMFPSFIAGVALAAFFAADRAQAPGWIARHAGGMTTASILLGLVLCSIPSVSALAIFPVAGLVLGLAFQKGPVNAFMASAPIVWLGKISFSLYLTHFTVLHLIIWMTAGYDGAWVPTGAGAFTLDVLLIVLAVAAAVYYGFERPFANLGRTLLRGTIRQAAAQGAGQS